MANPTTNYGFVLPTATDLVTDLPADFDVALQGVDTRLKALQPGTTLGDLAYSSATANTNTRLGVGSTGNVLTISGGVPVWAAPAGGGKVLQVVTATTTTTTTNTTTTRADSGITATITPTLATSKVLVLIMATVGVSATAALYSGASLLRGATEILTWNTSGFMTFDQTGGYQNVLPINYLDSPATTSATTYKLTGSVSQAGSGRQIQFQGQGSVSSIMLLEIGA